MGVFAGAHDDRVEVAGMVEYSTEIGEAAGAWMPLTCSGQVWLVHIAQHRDLIALLDL